MCFASIVDGSGIAEVASFTIMKDKIMLKVGSNKLFNALSLVMVPLCVAFSLEAIDLNLVAGTLFVLIGLFVLIKRNSVPEKVSSSEYKLARLNLDGKSNIYEFVNNKHSQL